MWLAGAERESNPQTFAQQQPGRVLDSTDGRAGARMETRIARAASRGGPDPGSFPARDGLLIIRAPVLPSVRF